MYPSVPSNIKSKIKLVNSVLDIYTNLRTYSEKEIKCKLKNYFKFMVSRHPFDRLVSAYNHWFHGNSEVKFLVRYAELIEDHFHESELERNANGTALITFEQFLHLVIEEPKRFNNLHWRDIRGILMCLDIHGTIALVQDVLNVFVDISTAISSYLSMLHT